MASKSPNLEELQAKLDRLQEKQQELRAEISSLQHEFSRLHTEEESPKELASPQSESEKKKEPTFKPIPPRQKKAKTKSNIEKFIGENLINKIGIVVTIIGVGIGSKYAIEHELISPLTRVVLGYLLGFGLMAFAFKLKEKFEGFSAVLLSGAMAVNYFITYIAYSIFDLLPHGLAFVLMLIFTIFTSLAALKYNRQVIAHIGLVGAYAVPFLIGDESNATVLFVYMALINLGILFIAFKRYWKPLYYSSFILTWCIYLLWFANEFDAKADTGIAMAFAIVFFVIFYISFLANKLVQKQEFSADDIVRLLSNAFVFFGVGYAVMDQNLVAQDYLGLYALGNAVLHFVVAVLLFKSRLEDKKLGQLIAGLVLVFLTLAIPIQLDGRWVTLLWAAEAALLFSVGNWKGNPSIKRIAYPMLLLAFVSLIHDWTLQYDSLALGHYDGSYPIFINVRFLSSIFVVLSIGLIAYHLNKKLIDNGEHWTEKTMGIIAPICLFSLLYVAVRLEITSYWMEQFADSHISYKPEGSIYETSHYNYGLKKFRAIWVLNFSLTYFAGLLLLNQMKFRSRLLGHIGAWLSMLTILVFLTQGLWEISELREDYLNQNQSEYYSIGEYYLWIRYIALAFVGATMAVAHWHMSSLFAKNWLQKFYDVVFYSAILWIASSEVISWLDISGGDDNYRLGLSVLWGLYALGLISLGIWKKRRHIRVLSLILFGLTIMKLFVYDIKEFESIGKIAVVIVIGLLLLVASFLYNKYKQYLFGDDNE